MRWYLLIFVLIIISCNGNINHHNNNDVISFAATPMISIDEYNNNNNINDKYSSFLQMESIPATLAVKHGKSPTPIKKLAVDEEGDSFDLGSIHRECPHKPCPSDFVCPLEGGICCGKGRMCCPHGSTCLTTDPPTCVVDEQGDPFACASAKCKSNFKCPHSGVTTCCIGGTVCCRKGFTCRATSPPTCVRHHKAKQKPTKVQKITKKTLKMMSKLRKKQNKIHTSDPKGEARVKKQKIENEKAKNKILLKRIKLMEKLKKLENKKNGKKNKNKNKNKKSKNNNNVKASIKSKMANKRKLNEIAKIKRKLQQDQQKKVAQKVAEIERKRQQRKESNRKERNEEKGEIRDTFDGICTFSTRSQCPRDWDEKGKVGILNPTKRVIQGRNEFRTGAGYNSEWTWVHPHICCSKDKSMDEPSQGVVFIAGQCPVGARDLGETGYIIHRKYQRYAIAPGATMNPDWQWDHPRLCSVADRKKLMTLRDVCLISKHCDKSKGWIPRGLIGILLNADYLVKNEFLKGEEFKSDYYWVHPRICCRM